MRLTLALVAEGGQFLLRGVKVGPVGLCLSHLLVDWARPVQDDQLQEELVELG